MSKKLSLNDAIETLQSMFPHFERDILKNMIYQTNGHMERTIELLLQIDDSNKQNATAPSVPYQEETQQQESMPEGTPKHSLPDDFLMYRPKGSTTQTAPLVSSKTKNDEEYARHLQQELYSNQFNNTPKQVKKVTTNNIGTINSSQPQEPEETSFTEKLGQFSEYAKNKFKEFQMKFERNYSNDPSQYDSLLTQNYEDDEEIFEDKKTK
eukprot:gene2506-3212_t